MRIISWATFNLEAIPLKEHIHSLTLCITIQEVKLEQFKQVTIFEVL